MATDSNRQGRTLDHTATASSPPFAPGRSRAPGSPEAVSLSEKPGAHARFPSEKVGSEADFFTPKPGAGAGFPAPPCPPGRRRSDQGGGRDGPKGRTPVRPFDRKGRTLLRPFGSTEHQQCPRAAARPYGLWPSRSAAFESGAAGQITLWRNRLRFLDRARVEVHGGVIPCGHRYPMLSAYVYCYAKLTWDLSDLAEKIAIRK